MKKQIKKSTPQKAVKKSAPKKPVVKKNNPEQFSAFKILKKLGHNLIMSTGFNAKLDYVAELNNPFSASHPAVNIGRSVTGITLFIPKGMTGETLQSIKEKFTEKNNAKDTQDGIRKVSRTIFETIEHKKTRTSKSGRPVSSGKTTRVPGVNKRSLVLECFINSNSPKQTFELLAARGVNTTMPSIRWWFNDFKKNPETAKLLKAEVKTETVVAAPIVIVKKITTKKAKIKEDKKTAKKNHKASGKKSSVKVKL